MAIKPTFRDTEYTSPITEFALSIGAYRGEDYVVSGTAVAIAPYLLITAKHVVEDYWKEFKGEHLDPGDPGSHLHSEGNFNIVAIQFTNASTRPLLWDVRKIYFAPTTDVVFLFIVPFSTEAKEHAWKTVTINMLPPPAGSKVVSFGYTKSSALNVKNNVFWDTAPMTSTGVVKQVHLQRRDKYSINFPCIETNARFDGGMSGGPVFNAEGQLIAVVTANIPPFEEGQEHISYAALIWPSMLTLVDLPIINPPSSEFYPILELCHRRIIAAMNYERIGISDSALGPNTSIAFKIPAEKHLNYNNMSSAFILAVPDGIVFASPTQVFWTQSIVKAQQKNGEEIELQQPLTLPVANSKGTKCIKKVSVGGKAFVIAISGPPFLNKKNPLIILSDFEAGCQGNGDFDQTVHLLVEEIKEQLRSHLKVRDLKDTETIITIDFVITHFTDNHSYYPRIENWIVFSGQPMNENSVPLETSELKRWSNLIDGVHTYGAVWIGAGAIVNHIMSSSSQLPERVQFELFSIEDAVEYANLVIGFACDFQRFFVSIPNGGKPIFSAVFTPHDYKEHIIY